MSIQEFLKDGARHYQGTEEAVLRNIEACKDLTQVVRTSLGPNGSLSFFVLVVSFFLPS